MSTFTHMLFFGWPAQVVFDEVYFATFVGYYSKAMYYFDIHPPFAKLITVYFGKLVGATYDMDMTVIGNSLSNGVVLLRLLPLTAGICLPIVIYFLCRQLRFSQMVSFTAGILVVLENSLLVQSRFLLFDSIMILLGFAAILFYLLYVKKNGSKFLFILSALCASGAFSIKWTGLAFLLLVFLSEAVRIRHIVKVATFIFGYACIGLIFYLSIYAVHFAYLTHSGPGDAFMTERFQKTLQGNIYEHNDEVQPKGFFGKTIELNLEMLNANRRLIATHPYSSAWYTWPLMLRSVFYWQGTPSGGTNEYIYLLGNPLIYWSGFLAILFLVWKIAVKKLRDKVALFLVTGYLVNYLPFIFIGRVMFLYHYEAALVMSILALAYIIEKYVPFSQKKLLICVLVGLSLASFAFFAPLSYGLPMSDSSLKARMWFPTWR